MVRNSTVWERGLGVFGRLSCLGLLCSGECSPGHGEESAGDFEHIKEPHSEQGGVGTFGYPPENDEDDCGHQPV